MYEASFGLKRRPFAATPDVTCFLSSGPIQAALDELVVCVEQGQGIGILTAPAGTGKTLLCERLRFELGDRFETIFLRHASFLTRRALLQTILCELNLSYNHPSEQELRLELLPAIRNLVPEKDALVLICDEAHQLTDSLLEELRILADLAEAGRPLVRLVLVGQVSLEEKLTEPSLAAFNQRVRAQINLPTFDHAGSLDYIDYRLTWAGGRTSEVFTPGALDLLVKASDGVPRCINQLADHTLLLAFVAEQKPAGEELVREALNDLRQLPLHWNEPSPSRSLADHSEAAYDTRDSLEGTLTSDRDLSGYLQESTAAAAMYSYEPVATPAIESLGWMPAEFGMAVPPPVPQIAGAFEAKQPAFISRIEVGSDDWRQTVELFNPQTSEGSLAPADSGPHMETTLATDIQMTTTMSRRIQFHDLLQDAYAAAGELASPSLKSETLGISGEFEHCPSESVQQLHDDPLRTIDSHADSQPRRDSSRNTSVFHEEVVIDRYAAIDAGFAPPVVSTSDTMDPDEVRAFESDSQSPDSGIAIGGATTESNSDTPDEHHDAASLSSESVWQVPAINFESGHSAHSDRSDFAVDDGQNVLRADLDCQPVASETASRSDDGHSMHWDGIMKEQVATSGSNWLPVASDEVERVAKEVFSLGQSLHPTGALSANSESILTALRREVVDLDGIARSHTDQNSVISNELEWQSIETTPVEAVAEKRPFRYLFSMLRRKQQGLA